MAYVILQIIIRNDPVIQNRIDQFQEIIAKTLSKIYILTKDFISFIAAGCDIVVSIFKYEDGTYMDCNKYFKMCMQYAIYKE